MKTHRQPSPIERSINHAVGLGESRAVPIRVIIRCRACKDARSVCAHEAWPEGTCVVEWSRCPDCGPGGVVFYLDKDGKSLEP